VFLNLVLPSLTEGQAEARPLIDVTKLLVFSN
jgi:hypothetical protein